MTTKKNRKNRSTKKKNINHEDDILTDLKRFIMSRKLKKTKAKAKTLSNNRLNMSGGAEDDGRGVGLPLAAPTEKAAALKARVDDFISNKDTLRREEAEKAAEKEAEKSAAEKAAAAEAATSEAAAVESNYKEQMNTIDSQIQQKNTEIANLKKKKYRGERKTRVRRKKFSSYRELFKQKY